MRISTATIDCWLYVNTTTTAPYSDYQHHHWDIGPSDEIDATLNNRPTYIWALNGSGSDGNGSWSIPPGQYKTLNKGAMVRLSSPTEVSLTQWAGATNNIQATGSNSLTTHPVWEVAWPKDLTWNPGLGTPSTTTHRDVGQPTIQLGPPVFVPVSHHPAFLDLAGVLVESFVLSTGVGGRDWKSEMQYFQTPGTNFTASAWWAWTINLVA